MQLAQPNVNWTMRCPARVKSNLTTTADEDETSEGNPGNSNGDTVEVVPPVGMAEPGPRAVPDVGLWMPLGNNIIEKTSTSWPNKFNDCKDMCSIIMLQLTMSRNVAATQSVTTLCLQTRHFSTFALSKVSDEIVKVCLA